MKKSLVLLLAVLVVGVGAWYLYEQDRVTVVENEIGKEGVSETQILITSQEIRQENYMGSKPVITGDGALADIARNYVESGIRDFEIQANTDVPSMREEFGPDSPVASYTIDIDAEYVESDKTASIVLSQYVYTGGAHGSSGYKVFTASKESGKLLSLDDLIRADKQEAFLALVKQKLLTWEPAAGAGAPVVFEEEVKNLTFDSFQNWSTDKDNLLLYFSQYEVGPGVLGSFALPIPLSELATILK